MDDLDGTAHYRTLGLEPKSSSQEVKKVRGPPLAAAAHAAACRRWWLVVLLLPIPPTATHTSPPHLFPNPMPPPPPSPPQAYRLLAMRHHPDKGGDPAAFARLQAAFEVLSDPRKREVYDTWAKELQFRCVERSGWVALGWVGSS